MKPWDKRRRQDLDPLARQIAEQRFRQLCREIDRAAYERSRLTGAERIKADLAAKGKLRTAS